MTLVVTLLTEQSVYMISDAILSVHSEVGSLNSDMLYPTKPQVSISGTRAVAGLTQKIVKVGDGIFVGWSGDYSAGRRFVDYLKYSIKSRGAEKDGLLKDQTDYFKHHRSDLEEISTIIVHDNDNVIRLHPQGKFLVEEIIDFGKVYAMGSGAQAFLEHCVRSVPKRFGAQKGQPIDVDMIYFVMDYILHTLDTQTRTGFGVADGWGGWFEVLIKKGGDRLEKLDKIMYASMYWNEIEGRIQTSQIGRRFFQFYDDDHLFVLSQGRREGLWLNVISPPDDDNAPSKIELTRMHPHLLCMTLVRLETKLVTFQMHYNAEGVDFCGISKGLQGEPHAIRMNTQDLQNIIRSHLIDSESK